MPRSGAMRGSSRLRSMLADYLSTRMPQSIDNVREQYGFDEFTLPYPKKYDAGNPIDADVYPYVGAYITGSDQMRRTGNIVGAAVEYDTTYEVTLFVAARTALLGVDEAGLDKWEKPGRESAMRVRDDLTVIMRELLLTSPSLGTAGTEKRLLVNEDSLRESYPEPVSVNTYGAFSCSGLITVNINMLESTSVPYIGKVTDTNVIIDLIVPGEINAQVLQYPA